MHPATSEDQRESESTPLDPPNYRYPTQWLTADGSPTERCWYYPSGCHWAGQRQPLGKGWLQCKARRHQYNDLPSDCLYRNHLETTSTATSQVHVSSVRSETSRTTCTSRCHGDVNAQQVGCMDRCEVPQSEAHQPVDYPIIHTRTGAHLNSLNTCPATCTCNRNLPGRHSPCTSHPREPVAHVPDRLTNDRCNSWSVPEVQASCQPEDVHNIISPKPEESIRMDTVVSSRNTGTWNFLGSGNQHENIGEGVTASAGCSELLDGGSTYSLSVSRMTVQSNDSSQTPVSINDCVLKPTCVFTPPKTVARPTCSGQTVTPLGVSTLPSAPPAGVYTGGHYPTFLPHDEDPGRELLMETSDTPLVPCEFNRDNRHEAVHDFNLRADGLTIPVKSVSKPYLQHHFVNMPDPQHGAGTESCKTAATTLTSAQGEDSGFIEEAQEKADVSATSMPPSHYSVSPSHTSTVKCQVCADRAAGFHCGAYVCEACKKFFIRTAKKGSNLKCSKSKQCVVTRKLRTLCQACRYEKCLQLGMYRPGEGPGSGADGIAALPCRVCSAPSSGYHFGAITCEGCKGFFRRMTRERNVKRLDCMKGGSCPVTQTTRNMCKACRYQKCCKVGMSADGSRIGRQPNAIKHATLLEMQNQQDPTTTCSMRQSPVLPPQPADKLSKTSGGVTHTEKCHKNPPMLSDADRTLPKCTSHPGNTSVHGPPTNSNGQRVTRCTVPCDCRDVAVTGYTSRLPVSGPTVSDSVDIFHQVIAAGQELRGMTVRPAGDVEITQEDFQDLDSCWKSMMERFVKNTHATLRFAKKIPGFRNLKLDDQASLLQASAYPIVILSMSKCYNPKTKQYNYFNYTERERDLIFKFFPGFVPLREHFISSGDIVTMLQLDEVEYDFLSALILLSPDEGNVMERDKVWEVQENIADALQEYEERTYKDGGTRFGVMIARVAEFRLINLQHQQIVGCVIGKNPSFTVPQLFSEMFLS